MKKIITTLSILSVMLVGCNAKAEETAAKTNNNESITTTTTSDENPEVEMRVQDGYIQYYTGKTWKNLISTDELKGENGKDGQDGKDGVNGKNGTNGINGKDGKNGTDGKNGKDGINGTNGKDGKDGVNGKDGKDGKNVSTSTTTNPSTPTATPSATVNPTPTVTPEVTVEPTKEPVTTPEPSISTSSNPYSDGWSSAEYGAWQLTYNSTGVSLPNLGEASDWYSNAASYGYTVSSTPTAGSIAVYEGHVAYVTSVNADGSVNIAEGGYNGHYNERTVSASGTGTKAIIGYINL